MKKNSPKSQVPSGHRIIWVRWVQGQRYFEPPCVPIPGAPLEQLFRPPFPVFWGLLAPNLPFQTYFPKYNLRHIILNMYLDLPPPPPLQCWIFWVPDTPWLQHCFWGAGLFSSFLSKIVFGNCLWEKRRQVPTVRAELVSWEHTKKTNGGRKVHKEAFLCSAEDVSVFILFVPWQNTTLHFNQPRNFHPSDSCLPDTNTVPFLRRGRAFQSAQMISGGGIRWRMRWWGWDLESFCFPRHAGCQRLKSARHVRSVLLSFCLKTLLLGVNKLRWRAVRDAF